MICAHGEMLRESGNENAVAAEGLRAASDAERSSVGSSCDELNSRLAELEAVRRSDLEVTRQVSRAGVWYVVHDPITFRHHRMSVSDYRMFAEVRQGQTLGDCFRRLVDRGLLEDAGAEQFYGWIVQLHRQGLITLPIDIGVVQHRRAVEQRRECRRMRLSAVLFYRLPLFSPDAFLRRTVNLVAPLFSHRAVLVWLLAMMFSGMSVWNHRAELADPFRYASASQSAVLMVVLLVVLKGVHELGHAYACRYFGGAVPEMGLFFIVLTPCAYVNASASWGFPQRRRRIAVALAGMYFESIAAMGALLLWGCSDPSLLKAAAHQALILATVVTVGFNINPLMKFDGYYVLTDLLGIPDLRGDALYEWKRFIKRVLFGVRLPSVADTRRGSAGLAAFGCLVAAYGVTVTLGICLLILELPLIGPPLGLVFFLSLLWKKLWKLSRYTVSARELETRRWRAGMVVTMSVAAVIGIVLLLPTPRTAAAHGIVRYQFHETLYAPGDGRLASVEVEPGQVVVPGQPVCQLVSRQLQRESHQLRAAMADAALEVRSTPGTPPAKYAAAIAKLQRQTVRYQQAAADLHSLSMVAPVRGQILNPNLLKRPGTWVRRGDPVAVIGHGRRIVETCMSEECAAGCQPGPGDAVEICLNGDTSTLMIGEVLEVSPAARNTVTSDALVSTFGGPVELRPGSERSEEAWFSMRVLLPETAEAGLVDGARATVKFDARSAPVGVCAYRACCRFCDAFLMTR